jgi:hypothetical protein
MKNRLWYYQCDFGNVLVHAGLKHKTEVSHHAFQNQ